MITLAPRLPVPQPETTPPAVVLNLALSAEAARSPRPRPVEADEGTAVVRRGRDQAATPGEFAAPNPSAPQPQVPAERMAMPAEGPTRSWGDGATSAFVAQVIGQEAPLGDQTVSGRGPTSFRKSPVELYEQAYGRARRLELLFALEGEFLPQAA